MEKAENKKCEVCGVEFLCMPGDIENCQCSAVNLSGTTLQELKMKYNDCLCAGCLGRIHSDLKPA